MKHRRGLLLAFLLVLMVEAATTTRRPTAGTRGATCSSTTARSKPSARRSMSSPRRRTSRGTLSSSRPRINCWTKSWCGAGRSTPKAVAAVTRRLGRGTVTYVGVESLAGDLERDLLRRVFTTAGVAVENYDDQFLVDWRDGFRVATNFTSKRQPAPAPPNAKLLVGSRTVEPAGVTVWAE